MLLNCPHCNKTVASQAEYPEHPGTWVLVAAEKDLKQLTESFWKCQHCTGAILYHNNRFHPLHEDWQLMLALQTHLKQNNITNIKLSYILPALYTTDNGKTWRLYQYINLHNNQPYVGKAEYHNNQVTKWTP